MYGFINANERLVKYLNVTLAKRPGVFIHHLRIIGFLEADFNTALKFWFATHLIVCDKMPDPNEEQWGGGSPGRTIIEPAMWKLLAFEHTRVMYFAIAPFMNDDTACFARMIPTCHHWLQ